MTIAYGDLIGGISGDMFVASFLDLGLPLSLLRSELKKISSLDVTLRAAKKQIHNIRATQFRVICGNERRQPPRSWRTIRTLIQRSKLNAEIKRTGIEIFSRLAAAEGRVHGVPEEEVHFHEVGAVDSIVDIMSAAIALDYFNVSYFAFSTIPLGRGMTDTAHGRLPLPGPATLELLKKLPVNWMQLEGETVTPTGAAILSALGSRFGDGVSMVVEKIGYGAGTKVWPDRPNLFRLVLGTAEGAAAGDQILVMETNIDDMNPEFYDYVFDCLFAAGARDVFLTPVQMKKNRPATLLRVICDASRREQIAAVLFRETSTIGIRYHPVGRMVLKRGSAQVKTRFGDIRVKIVEAPQGGLQATPEYDDVKRIAARSRVPLKTVYAETLEAARKLHPPRRFHER